MPDVLDVQAIINDKTIIPHLKAASKDEALKAMAAALKDAGYLTEEEQYIKDVYLREAEGETGIGDYIAIPHGKSSAVQKSGVAIATIDEEIPWETLDGKGVRVIVLFAVGDSDESLQEHLKLLALFARKLGREEVIRALLEADTAADVREAFKH